LTSVCLLLTVGLISIFLAGSTAPAGAPTPRSTPGHPVVQLSTLGVTLSPTSGIVGSTVKAVGTGFASNTSISFTLTGVRLNSTCSTDPNGSFPGANNGSCEFSMPSATGGSHVFTASDGISSALATYFVNESLTVSPGAGAYGAKVDAVGTGFSAKVNLSLSLAGVHVNSTCGSDGNGSFPGTTGTPCTFTVPEAPGGNASVAALSPWKSEANIAVGSVPQGLAFDGGTREFFVSNTGSDTVSIISDKGDKIVGKVRVGSYPNGVAYDASLNEVFVANQQSNNVSVISDTNDTVVATVGVGSNPFGLAYDSGVGEVFVVDNGAGCVSVLSATNDTVVATVGVGGAPTAAAYDPATGEVFVANWASGNVSVISDTNNTVVATIAVGGGPNGVAYDPVLGEVFVASTSSQTVSVVSDSNDSVVATVSIGAGALGVTYASATGDVLVSNHDSSGTVSVISAATNTVVAELAVGSYPWWDAYDPATGQVFVANWGSNNVSVVDASSNGSAPFTIFTTLRTGVINGTAEIGQTISIFGTGFGSALAIRNFTLGTTALRCARATTGTCAGGTLTTASSGSLGAQFVVPSAVSLGPDTLSVTDRAGHTATTPLVIHPAPEVMMLTAAPTTVDLGQSTTFSVIAGLGSGNFSYSWSGLPKGCSGTEPSISCTPSSPGTQVVSVKVTDSNGVSVFSRPLNFTVFADPATSPPVGSQDSGLVDAGHSVRFSTLASLGTGSYLSYAWQGLPAGCVGLSAAVTCSGSELPAGNYSISVSVTDSNGWSSASSRPLAFVVLSDPTAARPTASRASADVGQAVTFSSTTALGSGAYTYEWLDLPTGCSTSINLVSPSCSVSGAGSFGVELRVTDTNNATTTSAALPFTVYLDPTSSLGTNRSGIDLGQSVDLTAVGTLGSGLYSYRWTGLPAGCGATGASTICLPRYTGRFSVQVEITDSNRASSTSSPLGLVVAPPLSGSISMSSSSPTPGESVQFFSNITGGTGGLSYSWAFGDGAKASGATAVHAFVSAGLHLVALWANDSAGGSVHATLNLTVTATSGLFGSSSSATQLVLVGSIVLIAAFVAALLFVRRRRRGATTSSGASPASGTDEGPADDTIDELGEDPRASDEGEEASSDSESGGIYGRDQSPYG
jgi:YVTN family beta-propeller protein